VGSKIHRNSLKPGHKILWYEIKEILGQGGFGITYLAYDPNLEKYVAVKEYLPIELAVRERDHSVHPVSEERGEQYKWGLNRFIKEARTLAKFEHPNIVRVLSVTEENNTAYMVMAYEHGHTLQQKLEGKKTLEEAELLKILIPLLGGLEQIHKAGFIHRDIKPDNIFIRNDGSPVLLDFGSARQALGEQTKTLTSLVTPGYAPFEQYYSKSDQQGPWTDIYGLGATLYRAIAGVPPMDAVDRSNAILKSTSDKLILVTEIGKGKYSERFLKAIDHALQFKEEDRPQTIKAWKNEFSLPSDPIKEAAAIERKTTQPGTRILKQQRRSRWSVSHSAIAIILLCAVVAFYYRGDIQHYLVPVEDQKISQPPVMIVKDEPKKEKSLEEQLDQAASFSKSGKYDEVLSIVKPLAEQGNAKAQSIMGDLHRLGKGLPRDDKKAVHWYRQSAEQDSAATQRVLGDMYFQGEGVPKDYVLAALWYKKSAEQGNALAQWLLGGLYEKGEGVTRDKEKALGWYKKSAEQGNDFAINKLNEITEVEAKRLRLEEEREQRDQERLAELEKKQKEDTIKTLLSQAGEDIKALRFSSPEGNNASEKYQQILEIDSDNTEAKQGLQTIVDKYIGLAKQAADISEFDKAIVNLDKATSVLPDSENIKYARKVIELKRKEEEEQRLAELEKKKAEEEQHLAELEKQQQEEEAKKKAEEETPVVDNVPPELRAGDVWEISAKYPVNCSRWEELGEKNGELVAKCKEYFVYSTTQDGNWKRFTDKNGNILAEFKPYYPAMKFPIKLGKTWEESYSGYVKGEQYPQWKSVFKAKVADYEKITVPYGTFEAYRIDYEDHWRVGLFSGVNKGSMWFTPEINHLLKNDNKGDPRWNFELINAQLQ